MPMVMPRCMVNVRIIVASAVIAVSTQLNAETIRFPKNNPAITLELPAGATAKFEDNGSLTIKLKGKLSYATLSELDHCVSDKEAAERAKKEAWDMYVGTDYLGRDHVSEKEKLADGILALDVTVVGQSSGEANSGLNIWAAGVVLWVNEKRCFLLSSAHDMGGMHDYLALRKSLRVVP